MSLPSLLETYEPWDPEERKYKEQTIGLLSPVKTQDEKSGHTTGSAWIINREGTKALLTFHTKLHKWLQLGGHTEKGEDILHTALREAREESGLNSIQIISPGIFDIDIHPIPPAGGTPGHFHYDIRFLMMADDQETLTVSGESKALKWVSFADIPRLTKNNPGILRMLEKTKKRLSAT